MKTETGFLDQRFTSLDVFRGMVIALMIIVNNPGSWDSVYRPLLHANFNTGLKYWLGCTPTDWVFPFFLFIVGVSMRFSFAKYDFTLSCALGKKIFGRSLTIFAMGLLLNAFPFIFQGWDLSGFRYMGVLQRIGLLYGISAILVLKFNCKKLQVVTLSILLGYWGILVLFGGNAPYSLNENIVKKLDIMLLGAGHLWQGYNTPFDPEGLLSTIPGIVTVLFGFRIGMWLQQSENIYSTSIKMIKTGLLAAVAGLVWGIILPVSKPLWTGSYTVHTAGLATFFLGCLVYFIEAQKIKKWTLPFVIFGTNSIFVFLATGIWVRIQNGFTFMLDGVNVSARVYLFETVFRGPWISDNLASLLFALTHLLFWWLILLWLFRRKIFIKI